MRSFYKDATMEPYGSDPGLKLQPAIFPLCQHVIHFHKLPADSRLEFKWHNDLETRHP